jgi:hypothetical protein
MIPAAARVAATLSIAGAVAQRGDDLAPAIADFAQERHGRVTTVAQKTTSIGENRP